jgi:YVTN family beta-propeller protein
MTTLRASQRAGLYVVLLILLFTSSISLPATGSGLAAEPHHPSRMSPPSALRPAARRDAGTTPATSALSSPLAAAVGSSASPPPTERPGPDAKNGPPFSVESVRVGSGPGAATYDSRNGFVYVTGGFGPGNVSVINGTKLVGVVPVGNDPTSPAYDPANGLVYVPNGVNGTVSVIRDMTVVASVKVGSSPYSATYDSGNGCVYVVNEGNATVSVINGTVLAGTVSVGTEPLYATYDTADGYVYVSNLVSNSVSVINGISLVATLSVGNPYFAAYDDRNGDVYVPGSSGVTVVNGTKIVGSVAIGGGSSWATYDSRKGLVYATNLTWASVINGTKLVGSVDLRSGVGIPYSSTYDPGNGYVYVVDSGAAGDNSLLVINNTAVVGSVFIGNSPYYATYDNGNGNVYVPNSGSANVSVIMTGFGAQFAENGLPLGTGWRVNVNGGPIVFSNSTTLSFHEPNGTYGYSVWTADRTYSASSGSFTVSGSAVNETVTFARVTYTVSFKESGLPPGTEWWANVTGGLSIPSFSSNLSFPEANGTYPYVISTTDKSYSAPSGLVSVNGGPVSEATAFTPAVYAVTFTERGLPIGTAWWVNVTGGPSTPSSATTLVVSEPNGTFAYLLSTDDKTYASAGGSFSVDGAAASETVTYSRVKYSVTFTESGLSPGNEWSVSIAGGPANLSTAGTLSVNEPNGTYAFTVLPVAGYSASPSSGSVVVKGQAISRALVFSSTPSATFLGLSQVEGYGVLAGLLAAIVATVVAVTLLRRRRAGRPPSAP